MAAMTAPAGANGRPPVRASSSSAPPATDPLPDWFSPLPEVEPVPGVEPVPCPVPGAVVADAAEPVPGWVVAAAPAVGEGLTAVVPGSSVVDAAVDAVVDDP